MKERELQNAAKKFVEICKKSDFETTLNKSQFQSDLNLALFDVLGGSLWETSDFYKNDYLSNYQQQIIKSDYAITGVVAQDGRTMAYYGYRFDQHLLQEQIRPVYVYLTLDINVNSTTVTVLVKQWLILSTAVFLFATTFAWLLAYKLTEPIRRITSNAKQLAKGEYDVHFESSGYTEIDKLSSNLTLAAKQLGETEFLKNELIANVSHDLKTPLTLIKSYAEMVRDLSGDDKNKRTEHLNVIIGESDRLALLVDDLMQLSKLEAHRNEINPSDFCLSAAVEKTVRNFLTLTDYHFVADIEKDLYAFADEQKIIQVITNLMSNAVNYTG
ncbi:MAG: HAMP domain-containing sensor histidine kinase, partial [Clostridia bacterium]